METSKTKKGTVKFFLIERGFGFITPEEPNEQEYFFHFTGLIGKSVIEKGVEVTYEVEIGKRGPKAINVQRIK